MTDGGSMLFLLAASLIMASASFILPCESSHRGDSGMSLPHYTTERQRFSLLEEEIILCSKSTTVFLFLLIVNPCNAQIIYSVKVNASLH